MKAKTIQFTNKHLKLVVMTENTQNLNIYGTMEEQQQQQESYFLICESCFWMATTLNHFKPKNNLPYFNKRCPICENKIDCFPIPDIN